jgi:hypothetical protein
VGAKISAGAVLALPFKPFFEGAGLRGESIIHNFFATIGLKMEGNR